jgi:hypothetical protein
MKVYMTIEDLPDGRVQVDAAVFQNGTLDHRDQSLALNLAMAAGFAMRKAADASRTTLCDVQQRAH